jgi:SAM-dependent methyltransferase
MDIRLDPTQRFSGRASSYARARPGYPQELFDHLFAVRALYKGCTVADLGAGTGIFSEVLLRHGMTVYAIEPNQEMRAVAEARLAGVEGFKIVVGSAEQTTLANTCRRDKQLRTIVDIEPTRSEAARSLGQGDRSSWSGTIEIRGRFNRAYSSLVERFSKDKDDVDRCGRTLRPLFIQIHHEVLAFKDHELESLNV